MKTFNRESGPSRNFVVIPAHALLVAGVLCWVARAWAQTAPILAIAPAGTNQISISITNNIGLATFDLEWIGALGNPNGDWTYAAIGVPGGTNFLLNVDGYTTTFFRAVLDSGPIPLWQAANPSETNSPILKVTILGPTNGAVLQ